MRSNHASAPGPRTEAWLERPERIDYAETDRRLVGTPIPQRPAVASLAGSGFDARGAQAAGLSPAASWKHARRGFVPHPTKDGTQVMDHGPP